MKENQEFENLKSFSEKILEEQNLILEKAEKEHPETKRLENLVNEEIEQNRNGWEKDGAEEYKSAIEKKQRINYFKEHPERFDEQIWHTHAETLHFLSEKNREEKLSELKEKELVELSNRTPESYLKNRKERLDKLKQELTNLPSMNLEIFKNEIYNKSPEKIKEYTDEKGKPIPGAYLNEWYNAIFDGKKLLSWKQLPLESSRKLFFYKGWASQRKGYKECNEKEIEMIENNLNGFLKAATENKDIESVVDSAILLKKIDNPEIISFVKEQVEKLQKSPEKSDKEKLISISEKISQIEK
ncbi:MAG: hypothetical protein AAB772_02990 [Patescibacteria group bacterium]